MSQTPKWVPWSVVIGVGSLGVALVAVAGAVVPPRPWSDLMLALGTALVIAAILGASVDPWFKRALLRDSFQAVFGHMLPAELRDELGWVYGQKVLCKRYDLRFVLIPTDDPDLLTARVAISRDMHNVSNEKVEPRLLFAMDEWFHAGRRSRITSFYCTQGEETYNETEDLPSAQCIVARKLAKEVTIKPQDHVTLVTEGEETKHLNDAWSLNLIYAAAEPRVTVEAPDGIAFSVMYGFSRTAGSAREIGHQIYRLPGTLLPGQVIQIRWWQTSGESGGEGQDSLGGESAGELREDRQVRVEPDPIQPSDSEREE